MMDDFLAILGAIALIIATVLILPFISFWLCYFGGWVASITIDDELNDIEKSMAIIQQFIEQEEK